MRSHLANPDITDSELQSKTIDFLRFPLIVGVVLIHSLLGSVSIQGQQMMAGGDFSLYSNVSYLFSGIIARIAVPLFFFFSGFLFFYRLRRDIWQCPFLRVHAVARRLVPFRFCNFPLFVRCSWSVFAGFVLAFSWRFGVVRDPANKLQRFPADPFQ